MADPDTVGKKPPPLQEWLDDMVRAVPDTLVRDIVADFRRGPSAPSSLAGSQSGDAPRAASGGTVERKPPPGIDYIDAMCTEQARIERLAAIKQQIENNWIEHLLSKQNDEIVTDYDPLDREHMSK